MVLRARCVALTGLNHDARRCTRYARRGDYCNQHDPDKMASTIATGLRNATIEELEGEIARRAKGLQ